MSAKNTHAVQPLPQTHKASDDLELKSVGNGRFVATFHRNAYRHPVRLQAPRKDA